MASIPSYIIGRFSSRHDQPWRSKYTDVFLSKGNSVDENRWRILEASIADRGSRWPEALSVCEMQSTSCSANPKFTPIVQECDQNPAKM